VKVVLRKMTFYSSRMALNSQSPAIGAFGVIFAAEQCGEPAACRPKAVCVSI